MLILTCACHSAFIKTFFFWCYVSVINQNTWSLDRDRLPTSSLVLCSAQVTIESYTKETMPPEWVVPTESFTFEVFQRKMDPAWQRQDLGVKYCTRKAYLPLPLFLNFSTETKAVFELKAVISFHSGPCTSLQPCSTQDICLLCGVCFVSTVNGSFLIINHSVLHIKNQSIM